MLQQVAALTLPAPLCVCCSKSDLANMRQATLTAELVLVERTFGSQLQQKGLELSRQLSLYGIS